MATDDTAYAWKNAWEEHGDGVSKLLRFMYEPVSHIHPSRLEKICPDAAVVRTLVETRRGWLQLNAIVLEKLKLKDVCPIHFLQPRQELVYERAPLLERLAIFLGAALFAEDIRRVVKRQERQEIINSLGDEVYTFAVRKARFFSPKKLQFPNENFAPLKLQDRVIASGRWCVTGCCDDLPISVKQRFQLKFHKKAEWEFPSAHKSEDAENLWQFVGRMLQRCREKGK